MSTMIGNIRKLSTDVLGLWYLVMITGNTKHVSGRYMELLIVDSSEVIVK